MTSIHDMYELYYLLAATALLSPSGTQVASALESSPTAEYVMSIYRRHLWQMPSASPDRSTHILLPSQGLINQQPMIVFNTSAISSQEHLLRASLYVRRHTRTHTTSPNIRVKVYHVLAQQKMPLLESFSVRDVKRDRWHKFDISRSLRKVRRATQTTYHILGLQVYVKNVLDSGYHTATWRRLRKLHFEAYIIANARDMMKKAAEHGHGILSLKQAISAGKKAGKESHLVPGRFKRDTEKEKSYYRYQVPELHGDSQVDIVPFDAVMLHTKASKNYIQEDGSNKSSNDDDISARLGLDEVQAETFNADKNERKFPARLNKNEMNMIESNYLGRENRKRSKYESNPANDDDSISKSGLKNSSKSVQKSRHIKNLRNSATSHQPTRNHVQNNFIPYPTNHHRYKHRKRVGGKRGSRKNKRKPGNKRHSMDRWIDAFVNTTQLWGMIDDTTNSTQSSCRRHRWVVDFEEIGWRDWIISPVSYYANFCSGRCGYPLNKNQRFTNHAAIQSLAALLGISGNTTAQIQRDSITNESRSLTDGGSMTPPCCVPDQMDSLTLLFFDQSRQNVVLKTYANMVVKSCACR